MFPAPCDEYEGKDRCWQRQGHTQCVAVLAVAEGAEPDHARALAGTVGRACGQDRERHEQHSPGSDRGDKPSHTQLSHGELGVSWKRTLMPAVRARVRRDQSSSEPWAMPSLIFSMTVESANVVIWRPPQTALSCR